MNNLNLTIRLMEAATEALPEDHRAEITEQIHHSIELLNDQKFMEADEILHSTAQRINFIMSLNK